MNEELDAVSETIKDSKFALFDEIPVEIWKTRKFDRILRLCNAGYKQNVRANSTNFPKKGDLGITMNYRCITAKIYKAQLLNLIGPETGKILSKNQIGFRKKKKTKKKLWRNLSDSDNSSNYRMNSVKSIWTTLFLIFQNHSTPYTEKRWKRFYCHNLPRENFTVRTMLYKNTKSMVWLKLMEIPYSSSEILEGY